MSDNPITLDLGSASRASRRLFAALLGLLVLVGTVSVFMLFAEPGTVTQGSIIFGIMIGLLGLFVWWDRRADNRKAAEAGDTNLITSGTTQDVLVLIGVLSSAIILTSLFFGANFLVTAGASVGAMFGYWTARRVWLGVGTSQ